MRVRVHDRAKGPHTALVGEWDPILPSHEQLFRETSKVAMTNGRRLLVITFDPAPISHVLGPRSRPPLDDVATRLLRQSRCGVSTRVTVSMSAVESSHAGAEALLAALEPWVEISELVLGSRQTLGTAHRGDESAIKAAVAGRGIAVRRLTDAAPRTTAADARQAVTRGKLDEAARLLGRPLWWARPAAGRLTLPWPSGRYLAVPASEPTTVYSHLAAREVQLHATDEGAVLTWPGDLPWLGFLSGPATQATVARSGSTRAAG